MKEWVSDMKQNRKIQGFKSRRKLDHEVQIGLIEKQKEIQLEGVKGYKKDNRKKWADFQDSDISDILGPWAKVLNLKDIDSGINKYEPQL